MTSRMGYGTIPFMLHQFLKHFHQLAYRIITINLGKDNAVTDVAADADIPAPAFNAAFTEELPSVPVAGVQ